MNFKLVELTPKYLIKDHYDTLKKLVNKDHPMYAQIDFL
jgi:hypothetical protein